MAQGPRVPGSLGCGPLGRVSWFGLGGSGRGRTAGRGARGCPGGAGPAGPARTSRRCARPGSTGPEIKIMAGLTRPSRRRRTRSSTPPPKGHDAGEQAQDEGDPECRPTGCRSSARCPGWTRCTWRSATAASPWPRCWAAWSPGRSPTRPSTGSWPRSGPAASPSAPPRSCSRSCSRSSRSSAAAPPGPLHLSGPTNGGSRGPCGYGPAGTRT